MCTPLQETRGHEDGKSIDGARVARSRRGTASDGLNSGLVVPGVGVGVDAPDERPRSGGLVSPLFSNMARRFLT